ncbi:MAG: hypothetical protein AMJ79_07350 [Phycisphaerae bacterium SM23_30]|nr:MAG: hypothetical protein AMJ79_07350 [Phycisphaerae bacterium SM23_30]
MPFIGRVRIIFVLDKEHLFSKILFFMTLVQMTPAKLKLGILGKEKIMIFIFSFPTASSYLIDHYGII